MKKPLTSYFQDEDIITLLREYKMMTIYIQLPILIVSIVLGILFKRLLNNSVIGFVIGGSVLHYVYYVVNIDPVSLISDPVAQTLALIGLVLLGLEIGSEFSISSVRKILARVVILEFFSVTLIWFLLRILSDIFSIDPVLTLLLFLITLNTSTGVLYKHLKTLIGIERAEYELILGIVAFEDILAVLGLSISVSLLSQKFLTLYDLVVRIGGLILISISLIYLGYLFFKRISSLLIRDIEFFGLTSLFISILYAYIVSFIGFSPFLGSFLAGVAIGSSIDPKIITYHFSIIRELGLLFYFSLVGILLPKALEANIILILVGIIISLLTMLLKYIGFSISSWLIGVNLRNSLRYGIYMTSLSEIGVVVANEFYRRNLVDEVYVALAIMIFIFSTILSSTLTRKDLLISETIYNLLPTRIREIDISSYLIKSLERKGSLVKILEYIATLITFILILEYINYFLRRFTELFRETSIQLIILIFIAISLGIWFWAYLFNRFLFFNILRISKDRDKSFYNTVLTLFIAPGLIIALLYQLRAFYLLRDSLDLESSLHRVIFTIASSLISLAIALLLLRISLRSFRYRETFL